MSTTPDGRFQSFYDQVGGHETFRRLVHEFYRGVADDEKLRALYPEDFHVRNIQDRLARVGDPFASFFAQPQSLAPLLDGGRLRRVRPLA